MVELFLALSASFSLILVIILFYLSIKHRDFYTSEAGKEHILKRKTRFKVAAVLGIAAFLLFVGTELLETSRIIGMEPGSLTEFEEKLEIFQLALLILSQLFIFSIAVETKGGEKVGAG